MKQLWIIPVSILLVSCGAPSSTENRTRTSVNDVKAQTLTWDKLMPVGGYDALDSEQQQFYADLSRKLLAGSNRLYDLPKGNVETIEEGSSLDYMPQLGTFDTVDQWNGKRIRIPGYVVPLDFEENGKFREFLFVPTQGACIHTPPPPPNQVIYVELSGPMPIKNLDLPYWLEGILQSERNDHKIGSAAYTVNDAELTAYPIMQ